MCCSNSRRDRPFAHAVVIAADDREGADVLGIGGAIDLVFMRVSEIFQVVPSFILAAVIVALSGPGLLQVVVVISLLAWPQVARLMRG